MLLMRQKPPHSPSYRTSQRSLWETEVVLFAYRALFLGNSYKFRRKITTFSILYSFLGFKMLKWALAKSREQNNRNTQTPFTSGMPMNTASLSQASCSLSNTTELSLTRGNTLLDGALTIVNHLLTFYLCSLADFQFLKSRPVLFDNLASFPNRAPGHTDQSTNIC